MNERMDEWMNEQGGRNRTSYLRYEIGTARYETRPRTKSEGRNRTPGKSYRYDKISYRVRSRNMKDEIPPRENRTGTKKSRTRDEEERNRVFGRGGEIVPVRKNIVLGTKYEIGRNEIGPRKNEERFMVPPL